MVETLGEVRSELQTVKQALRNGGTYLGMGGETLQQHFLLLNEKENRLIATIPNGDAVVKADAGAAKAATNGHVQANGVGTTPAAQVVVSGPTPTPREFDRDSLPAVVAHLREFAEIPAECGKGLKALASLAYSGPAQLVNHEEVLPLTLKLLSAHTSNQNVQLYAVRTLVNMASDDTAAMGCLAEPPILAAVISAAIRNPDAKDLNIKTSEFIARIIAAGNLDGRPVSGVEDGKLEKLFVATIGGESSWIQLVASMVAQLTENEVTTHTRVAQQLQLAMENPETTSKAVVLGLDLAKRLLDGKPDQQQAFIECGFISAVTGLMSTHSMNAEVQLAAMQANPVIIGRSFKGLDIFVTTGGVRRVEDALKHHLADSAIQIKGVRAIASGVDWPEDVQQKADYNVKTALDLTMAAMSAHADCTELQTSGLEAVAKYFVRSLCSGSNDNVAFLQSLAEPSTLAAMIASMVKAADTEGVNIKASRAIDKVIAAGHPDGRPIIIIQDDKLRKLFIAVICGDPLWCQLVTYVLKEFTRSTGADQSTASIQVAKQLQQAMESSRNNLEAVAQGLELAKLLATDLTNQQKAFIDSGFIPMVTGLLAQFSSTVDVQLSGLGALTCLIGTSEQGLDAFVSAGGVKRIEEALKQHPSNIALQTKGVRALASAVIWPKSMQQKADFNANVAVELTKQAMAGHGDCAELQAAGLEAIQKYLTSMDVAPAVKEKGGEGLVKAMMVRYQDDEKIQASGRAVLTRLGVDPAWTPKGIAR